MAVVQVSQVVRASAEEAERCWVDVSRWPDWVDGLARVVAVEHGWPRAGSEVIWESVPAGRGRVVERVAGHEPGHLSLEVEDDSMDGFQEVGFEPVGDSVRVELTLEYRIKRRAPWTPVVERLFVRRPMILSLTKTLARFAATLERSRGAALG